MSNYIKALAAIVPLLSKSQQRKILLQALEIITDLKEFTSYEIRFDKPYEYSRVQALNVIKSLLPGSPKDVVEGAFSFVVSAQSEKGKAEALNEIAFMLFEATEELRDRIFEDVVSIQDKSSKAIALCAIAPFLTEPQRQDWLKQALDDIRQALDDTSYFQELFDKVATFKEIVFLSKSYASLMQQAFTVANTIKDRKGKGKGLALIAFASCLDESDTELIEQTLNAINTIEYPSNKIEILSTIVPFLPESRQHEVLKQALSIIEHSSNIIDSIVDTVSRSIALYSNTSDMELMEQFLTIINIIKKDEYKADALRAIVPYLDKSNTGLLEQALSTANAIASSPVKVRALSGIVPFLSEHRQHEVLKQALDTASLIQNKDIKPNALIAIAPLLPESRQHEVLDKAIATVADIENDNHKVYTLSRIAPLLPESRRHKVLEEAFRVTVSMKGDEEYKLRALLTIAPLLSEPQIHRALESTISVYGKIEIVSSTTASFLSESEIHRLIETALKDAVSMPNESDQISAIRNIVHVLPNSVIKSVAEELLSESLNAFSILLKKDPEAMDTYGWGGAFKNDTVFILSRLVPHLPNSATDLIQQAFKVANSLWPEFFKADALCVLALHLPESKRQKVLEQVIAYAVGNSGDTKSRIEVLNGMIPRLKASDTKLLEQTVNAANTIEYPYSKVETLSTIALHLNEANIRLQGKVLTNISSIIFERYEEDPPESTKPTYADLFLKLAVTAQA